MITLSLLLACIVSDEINFTVRTPPGPPAQPKPPAAAAAPAAVDPAGYYVVVYSAKWCGPCQRWKRDELASLKASGVAVTVVDVDEQPQWNQPRWVTDKAKNQRVLIPGITSLPTFQVVRRSDRIPVWQTIGYQTAKSLAARIPQPPKQNPEQPTPPPPESG